MFIRLINNDQSIELIIRQPLFEERHVFSINDKFVIDNTIVLIDGWSIYCPNIVYLPFHLNKEIVSYYLDPETIRKGFNFE